MLDLCFFRDREVEDVFCRRLGDPISKKTTLKRTNILPGIGDVWDRCGCTRRPRVQVVLGKA